MFVVTSLWASYLLISLFFGGVEDFFLYRLQAKRCQSIFSIFGGVGGGLPCGDGLKTYSIKSPVGNRQNVLKTVDVPRVGIQK